MENKVYYVYEHWRKDNSTPFYVGVGTKNKTQKTNSKIYSRAHLKAKSKRTSYWTEIYKECGEIDVRIVFETDSLYTAHEKENLLIKQYGRLCYGTGSLCNRADGGRVNWGVRWNEQSKKRKSEACRGENGSFYGRNHSQKTKDLLRKINKGNNVGNKNPFFGRTHSEKTRAMLSANGKKRAKMGDLPKLNPQFGSCNKFSKMYLAIQPSGVAYFIHGGIRRFCKEFNLSYDYVKKFKNKGKCYAEDPSRSRAKSKNTEGWSFLSIEDKDQLKGMKVTIVEYDN